MKFLQRGVRAHLENDYVVSVPVLLPHVEGILREYFKDLDLEIDDKFGLNNAVGILELIILKEILLNVEKSILKDALKKMSETIKETNDSVLNRGLILHGKCLNYDREIVSAQLIYMLDTICYFTKSEVDEIKDPSHQKVVRRSHSNTR